MKVELLEPQVINGSVEPKGKVLDLPEKEAKALIAKGKAKAVKSSLSTSASTSTEDKTKA